MRLPILILVFCVGAVLTDQAQNLTSGKGKAMSAPDVYRIYKANSIVMEKYENKRHAVYGVVRSVSRDILGSPYVILDCGPSALFAVQCVFPRADAQRLEQVLPGQRVTIEGKLLGKLGNVVFSECVFVQ